MKLLLDQGLPRSTVTHLAAEGITAEHVADLGMATAADAAILATARQWQAIVGSGLKGRNNPAQGNALGIGPAIIVRRPEGAKQRKETAGAAKASGIQPNRIQSPLTTPKIPAATARPRKISLLVGLFLIHRLSRRVFL
jgi:hypothetical protein